MNTIADLMVLEVVSGYEILEREELFEAPLPSLESQTDEICIISGTLTVSP